MSFFVPVVSVHGCHGEHLLIKLHAKLNQKRKVVQRVAVWFGPVAGPAPDTVVDIAVGKDRAEVENSAPGRGAWAASLQSDGTSAHRPVRCWATNVQRAAWRRTKRCGCAGKGGGSGSQGELVSSKSEFNARLMQIFVDLALLAESAGVGDSVEGDPTNGGVPVRCLTATALGSNEVIVIDLYEGAYVGGQRVELLNGGVSTSPPTVITIPAGRDSAKITVVAGAWSARSLNGGSNLELDTQGGAVAEGECRDPI